MCRKRVVSCRERRRENDIDLSVLQKWLRKNKNKSEKANSASLPRAQPAAELGEQRRLRVVAEAGQVAAETVRLEEAQHRVGQLRA